MPWASLTLSKLVVLLPRPVGRPGITASISSFVLQPLSRKASAPAARTDARDVAYIVSTTILVAGHLLLIIRIVAKPSIPASGADTVCRCRSITTTSG